MSEDWDRRQMAEDRWRKALKDHEDDARAHSEQRHQFINDTIAPFHLRMDGRLVKVEVQQQQDALERSELRGVLRVLRWELAAIGALLLTVAGAVAYVVVGKLAGP